MKLAIAAVSFALVVMACNDATEASPTVASTTTTTSTTSTLPPSDTTPEPPCLAGDEPFRGVGLVGTAGEDGGDARQIAALRWAPHEGCERFVIDLASADGAPATSSGPVTAELLEAGVVRVTLPPVVGLTAVADTAFEGSLAERAFVVRDFPGTLLVDLHLSSSSEARVASLASPARVVIDIKPGSQIGTPSAPAIGDNVVLFQPSAGSGEYPIRVSGYARTFEATVVARLMVLGEVAFETFTTATDYLDAWGRFDMEIPAGPNGRVDVFVGEDSAATGDPQGVIVELSMP